MRRIDNNLREGSGVKGGEVTEEVTDETARVDVGTCSLSLRSSSLYRQTRKEWQGKQREHVHKCIVSPSMRCERRNLCLL